MASFTALPTILTGYVPTGDDWNSVETAITEARTVGLVIARGQRLTDSTANAAEQGVLRLDNISLTSGWIYAIYASGQLTSTVGSDQAQAIVRYSTSGAATTSSTLLVQDGNGVYSAINAPFTTVGFYVPGSNQTLSVLLSSVRQAGTGNVSMRGSVTPTRLWVACCGVDPGDSGVSI